MQFVICEDGDKVVATIRVTLDQQNEPNAFIKSSWPNVERHIDTYEAFQYLNLALRDHLTIDAYQD